MLTHFVIAPLGNLNNLPDLLHFIRPTPTLQLRAEMKKRQYLEKSYSFITSLKEYGAEIKDVENSKHFRVTCYSIENVSFGQLGKLITFESVSFCFVFQLCKGKLSRAGYEKQKYFKDGIIHSFLLISNSL